MEQLEIAELEHHNKTNDSISLLAPDDTGIGGLRTCLLIFRSIVGIGILAAPSQFKNVEYSSLVRTGGLNSGISCGRQHCHLYSVPDGEGG